MSAVAEPASLEGGGGGRYKTVQHRPALSTCLECDGRSAIYADACELYGLIGQVDEFGIGRQQSEFELDLAGVRQSAVVVVFGSKERSADRILLVAMVAVERRAAKISYRRSQLCVECETLGSMSFGPCEALLAISGTPLKEKGNDRA